MKTKKLYQHDHQLHACIRSGKVDLLLHSAMQLLNLHVYSLQQTLYTFSQSTYGTTAIKSGCVMVWKMIMTVEAAGLSH